MADKTVILKLEVQGFGAAKTDLEFLTTESTKAAEAQRKLSTESRNVAKVINAEKGSIEYLRAETALLRQEEAKLGNVTDANGKKRAALQKQIVANTTAIRDHDRQISGSKTLVGEYEKGFTSAFKNITASIGVVGGVVATLYGGFKTLTSVIKSTEEGADLLEAKMSGLNTSMAVIKGSISDVILGLVKGKDSAIQWGDVLSGLNASLVALGPAGLALQAQFNKILGDSRQKINDASKAGEEYANNLDIIEDNENKLIVSRAKATASLKEARLKLAESNIPANERIKLLTDALNQEKSVSEEEQRLAEMRYRDIKAYNQMLSDNGILKRENIKLEEEAEAKVIELQSESASRQIRVAKELKKAKEEVYKTEQKEVQYTDELIKTYNEQQIVQIQTLSTIKGEAALVDQTQMQDNAKKEIEYAQNNAKELERIERQKAETKKQIELSAIEAIQSATDVSFSNQKAALNEQMSAELSNENLTEKQKVAIRKKYAKEQQKIDIKQAIINGILSIAKTFATLGWPAGIIPAALAAAQTAIQVAAIKAQKFARGGKIIGGAMIQADKSGDNTLVVAKQGEVILNHHQQAKLGGAATFKRLGVPGFAGGGLVGSIEQSPGIGFDINSLADKIIKGFNDKQVNFVFSEFEKNQRNYNLITKAVPL